MSFLKILNAPHFLHTMYSTEHYYEFGLSETLELFRLFTLVEHKKGFSLSSVFHSVWCWTESQYQYLWLL